MITPFAQWVISASVSRQTVARHCRLADRKPEHANGHSGDDSHRPRRCVHQQEDCRNKTLLLTVSYAEVRLFSLIQCIPTRAANLGTVM